MQYDLLSMVLRLLLAAGLGGVVGFEREAHGRPAGLRTHILVSLGAALFTVTSETFGGRSDPSRIAAQIVSGIGFLGAGTIIRQGSIVRGLTTAASLWTTAAIGMAAASHQANLIILSVVAALIVLLTLTLINRLEYTMIGRQVIRDLVITFPGGRAGVAAVLEVLSRFGVVIQGVSSEELEGGVVVTRFHLRLPPGANTIRVGEELAQLPEVREFDWE